jgi:hypothetical protein
MLFNSTHFLFVFLPVTLAGFAILGRFGRRPVIGWLAFVSILFYGEWNLALLVLLGSIVGNFLLSRLISANRERPRRQTIWLIRSTAATWKMDLSATRNSPPLLLISSILPNSLSGALLRSTRSLLKTFRRTHLPKSLLGEKGGVWISVPTEQFMTLQFPKDAEGW